MNLSILHVLLRIYMSGIVLVVKQKPMYCPTTANISTNRKMHILLLSTGGILSPKLNSTLSTLYKASTIMILMKFKTYFQHHIISLQQSWYFNPGLSLSRIYAPTVKSFMSFIGELFSLLFSWLRQSYNPVTTEFPCLLKKSFKKYFFKHYCFLHYSLVYMRVTYIVEGIFHIVDAEH